MTSLADRFNQALDFSGKSKADLAKACKVHPSAVSQWFNGKTKELAASNLTKAAAFLGVSARWLSTGRGEMTDGAVIPLSEDMEVPDDVVGIPSFVIRASAGPGAPIYMDELEATQEFYSTAFLAAKNLKPKDCKVFIVTGSSMEPFLWDGDKVLVDCTPIGYDDIKEGSVYVFTYYGEMRIKILFKDLRRGLVVKSYNQNVPDEILTAEELNTNFGMVGRVRDRRGSGFL